MRFLIGLSLIFNPQLVSLAKQDLNLSAQSKINQKLVEEKNIQQFVEMWNNSENTKMLLQKFNIESQQLKRLENDLQNEKILMKKPPQLEYWPQHKVLWMNFEGSKEKLLIVNRDNPSQSPVIYAGYRFLQIQKNNNMTDNYFQFKKQLKDSLKEQLKLENSWSSKKTKKVSSLNLILTLFNEQAFADVVSVPFTSKKKEKTNWIPWIALGGFFGALALWKGGEYLYKNYGETPAEATPKSDVALPNDASDKEGGSNKVTTASEGGDLTEDEDAGAASKSVASSTIVAESAPKSSSVQSLNLMVEIEQNLKKLETQDKLFIRQMLCSSNHGTVFKVERIGSNSATTYGVASAHPNNIAITVPSGEETRDCYYDFNTNKFTSKNQYCPADKDKELMFSQQETFKNLQRQINTCCEDLPCKGNLLNLIGAEIQRIDPTAPTPLINGNSVK